MMEYIFNNIDISSKEIMDRYFNIVDYEACEYSFTTLYMWKDLYNLRYYYEDRFMVIMGQDKEEQFFIQPLADIENIKYALEFIFNYFDSVNKNINMRAITKEFKDYLNSQYPNKFKYMEDRNSFDYIYEGESLRTLQGRKNQKKRNHLNYFLKEYENRFEYKLLSEENFDECNYLLESWMDNKEITEDIKTENRAINRLFKNYKQLKNNIKVCGVYIDDKLEAFSIGEKLTKDMALIHIEKANFNLRGLYQYVNQQFILNEFDDIEFVNREDDLGIEGVRKAKLSYHPVKFVEKFNVIGN